MTILSSRRPVWIDLVLAATFLLVLTGLLFGQTLTVPKSVNGDPGDFIAVSATTDCAGVQWYSIDKGLKLFPVNLLKDTKTAVVSGSKGTYRLLAYAAKGDIATAPVVCLVVIGDAPPDPGPGPGPGPNPPDPKPADAPIALPGNAVLMVREIGDRLPATQQAIFTAQEIRQYLNAACQVDPSRSDWKAFRIWDKDVDASGEHKVWQDAFKRPRKELPWIILSNGKTGYEGPLPKTVEDTLKLLKDNGIK